MSGTDYLNQRGDSQCLTVKPILAMGSSPRLCGSGQ